MSHDSHRSAISTHTSTETIDTTSGASVMHGPTICPGDVAVDVRSGLPSLTVVGAPDRYSLQVVERLRELDALPPKRITIGLRTRGRRRHLPPAAELAEIVALRTKEAC